MPLNKGETLLSRYSSINLGDGAPFSFQGMQFLCNCMSAAGAWLSPSRGHKGRQSNRVCILYCRVLPAPSPSSRHEHSRCCSEANEACNEGMKTVRKALQHLSPLRALRPIALI